MAEIFLDLVGLACPAPLLETKKKFNELALGDVLMVETENSRAVRNIMDWAWREGHSNDVEEIENGQWRTLIKKS